MPVYKDDLNRTFTLSTQPCRIVSVVPSQTELLYTLGLDNEVVGITKFCVHPKEWFQRKERIGGTKNLDIEKIKSLNPDLIIANKEENDKQQIEALAANCPVWVSDIHSLSDALRMIDAIGIMVGKEEKAKELVHKIEIGFRCLTEAPPKAKYRVCYLIWKDPYITVGGDTFISHILQWAGLENMYASEARYPSIDIATLPELGCQLLLLSSEPYPFKQKHIAEIQAIVPGVPIFLVDGEMFSWYGSRLLYTAPYLKELQQQFEAV